MPVTRANATAAITPTCLPMNRPSATPSVTGAAIVSHDSPVSDTPALAKAKAGMIAKATQGCRAWMQRLARECSSSASPRRAQRDAQPDDGAGQCRVHARFQHARPDIDADQHIGGEALHPEAVHGDEDRDADRGKAERQQRQVGGVEDRDDDDGAEVVDDREREQKDLQALGHAVAEQADHAHGERDVGGGRDRPAAQRFRRRRR